MRYGPPDMYKSRQETHNIAHGVVLIFKRPCILRLDFINGKSFHFYLTFLVDESSHAQDVSSSRPGNQTLHNLTQVTTSASKHLQYGMFFK